MFAKIDEEACEAILEVLWTFCNEFRQEVSLEKSRIYFSPNVEPEVRDKLCERLDIRAITIVGKYLGFPIKHRRATRN